LPQARQPGATHPDIRVTQSFTVSDFDYELPPELIAQTPAAQRTGSRLLHLDAASQLHDRQFADLTSLLRPNDLLVFNDTRVIKARLPGHKITGGKIEVLVERITEPDRVLAHVRASKSPGPGMVLRLADAFEATVLREGLDLARAWKQCDKSDLSEGLYIKAEADGKTLARYKWVRRDFVQAILDSDMHHSEQPYIPNLLADGVDLYAPRLAVDWDTLRGATRDGETS